MLSVLRPGLDATTGISLPSSGIDRIVPLVSTMHSASRGCGFRKKNPPSGEDYDRCRCLTINHQGNTRHVGYKKKVKFDCYRELLLQKREDLIHRLYERRSLSATEQDLVDDGAFALQNVMCDLAVTNMEREIRTLTEVELSLRLLDSGQYGLCGSCGSEIPSARLQALPWTRMCVACAGGEIDPAAK
jgi:DnaK suppressor protein